MIEKNLRSAFQKYYKSCYGKLLSQKQLEHFINFMLGKNVDVRDIEKELGIVFDGFITNREAFAYQYQFVYDTIPTEEQLDVFISFRLGILKNEKILNEVCAKKLIFVQPEQ